MRAVEFIIEDDLNRRHFLAKALGLAGFGAAGGVLHDRIKKSHELLAKEKAIVPKITDPEDVQQYNDIKEKIAVYTKLTGSGRTRRWDYDRLKGDAIEEFDNFIDQMITKYGGQ